jgi:hypothetical protein
MTLGAQSLSKAMLVLLVAGVVLMDGCERHDVHQIMRQNFQAPNRSPKVLAVYMPWFGDNSHIDVGYSSEDPNALRRQVDQARGMGISAFVVDWYGDRDTFLDKSFATLQQVAHEKHFQVALMYDETENNNGEATNDALEALDKAYKTYIGPNSPAADSYLTYKGRPVIFIFPKRGGTDWNRVRAQVNTWPAPPLFIYKDTPPDQFAADFDGYYAWVHPGDEGWRPDGSDWGKEYLDKFYKTMREKYPNSIAVGAAWPGFDDSRAKWGLNRYMDARCGKTFEDTLHLFRSYYSESDSMPFLMVETWNDYEEGTAVERSHGCGNNDRPQPGPYAQR